MTISPGEQFFNALFPRALERFASFLTTNPHIRKFKEPNVRIRWLTQNEAARLVTKLSPHLGAMARFTLATGLRESNVLELEWQQIDRQRHVAWIHPGQGRKAIGVSLNDDAVAVLKAQIGKYHTHVFTYEGKLAAKAGTLAWRKALKRAGIEQVRWHDLRHTWASWHVQNGTHLNVLQELGGWASYEMVQQYGHLAA